MLLAEPRCSVFSHQPIGRRPPGVFRGKREPMAVIFNQQPESSQSVATPALLSSEFLRTEPAAEYLRGRFGFGAASSLNKFRVFGGGPRFYKVGKKIVLYKRDDLDTWARALMSERISTSDSGAAS